MSSYKAVSLADPTVNPWNRTAKKAFRNISEHSQWVQYNNESERRRLNKRCAQMDREHARQMRIMEADVQEVKNELRSLELQKRLMQDRDGNSRISSRGIKRRDNTAHNNRRKSAPASSRTRKAGRRDDAGLQPQPHSPIERRGLESTEASLPMIHEKPEGIAKRVSNPSFNQPVEVEKRVKISNDESSTSTTPLLDQHHQMSITETIYYLSFQARQRFMDQAGLRTRYDNEKQGTTKSLGETGIADNSGSVKSTATKPSVRTSAAFWGILRDDMKVVRTKEENRTKSNREALPSWKRDDTEEKRVHTPCGRCDECIQKMRSRRDNVMQQLYGQGRHIAERMERRRLISGSAGWHALKSVVIINNALKKTHQKEQVSLPGT